MSSNIATSIPDFQNSIKETIADGELVNAMQLMKSKIVDKEKRNVIIALLGRFNRNYDDRHIHGVLSHKNFAQTCEQIQHALISTIDDLKEGDLGNSANIEEAIKHKIWTISLDKFERESLHGWLNPSFYPECEAIEPSSFFEESNKQNFNQDKDIVIFNASQFQNDIDDYAYRALKPPQRSWLAHLEKIVTDTNFLVVYFGNYYYRLSEWRTRVHAANSPFTLYSRVKEVSDFIEIHRS
jgi:hypothetical protein